MHSNNTLGQSPTGWYLGQCWAHSAKLPALVQDVVWGGRVTHREGTEAYSYLPRANSLINSYEHAPPTGCNIVSQGL